MACSVSTKTDPLLGAGGASSFVFFLGPSALACGAPPGVFSERQAVLFCRITTREGTMLRTTLAGIGATASACRKSSARQAASLRGLDDLRQWQASSAPLCCHGGAPRRWSSQEAEEKVRIRAGPVSEFVFPRVFVIAAIVARSPRIQGFGSPGAAACVYRVVMSAQTPRWETTHCCTHECMPHQSRALPAVDFFFCAVARGNTFSAVHRRQSKKSPFPSPTI